MKEPDDLIPGGKNGDGPNEPERHIQRVGFYVYNHNKEVILDFEQPVEHLAMGPHDAMKLAKEIHDRAKRLLRGGGGQIPRA